YDGFNADEQGRRVFDGLMPHVAGGGMGYFNHRFASPTRHNSQHDNHLYPADVFPFTYGNEKDPFTRREDGILRRARESKVVPKVMHVQTSSEYWHRSGSLVHTDPTGSRDAVIPPEVRIYVYAGAQHGAGSGVPRSGGAGILPRNPTDYRPFNRALLSALDAWVKQGIEPPPSVYPKISDGDLVDWQWNHSGWKPLPGLRYPGIIQRPPFADRGPEFFSKRRTTIQPPKVLGHYGVKVLAYGDDDNELGGLSAPCVAVPLGTYLSWNTRSRSIGAEQELLSLQGGYVPFARTKRERVDNGDPRGSLEERYRGQDDYLERCQSAVRKLVAQRYLLEEDAASLNDLARRLGKESFGDD
ncbi:MAG: alpha/beta hydrolase domain-containing protein, partial [Planctomycetales bacterium]